VDGGEEKEKGSARKVDRGQPGSASDETRAARKEVNKGKIKLEKPEMELCIEICQP